MFSSELDRIKLNMMVYLRDDPMRYPREVYSIQQSSIGPNAPVIVGLYGHGYVDSRELEIATHERPIEICYSLPTEAPNHIFLEIGRFFLFEIERRESNYFLVTILKTLLRRKCNETFQLWSYESVRHVIKTIIAGEISIVKAQEDIIDKAFI